MLQFPVIALKISTTALDVPPKSPASAMSNQTALKTHLTPPTHAFTHPLLTSQLHDNLPAIIALTETRRTLTTSEDSESLIRQRCSGQPTSSFAENCSAPVSRDRIEDVHSFRIHIVTCTNDMACCSTLNTPHFSEARTQPPMSPSPRTTSFPAIIAITVARRTLTTSEDRESLIWQRCGGQPTSSLAENCSAPVSRDRIEDINNSFRRKQTTNVHCKHHQ